MTKSPWLPAIAFALLSTLFFSSCAAPNPDVEEGVGSRPIPGTAVYRVVDAVAGVVCWTYDGTGISCLPIEQTKIKIGE